MRDPKRRAKSMAILWLKKCYDLSITAGEVVAESAVTTSVVTTVTQKENGEGKRELPPTPPIEKREEAKEKAATATAARARARGKKSEIFPPTIEMVYAECESEKIPRLYGDYFMEEQTKEHWRHPKTGRRINSWRRALLTWWHSEGNRLYHSKWEDYQSDHTTEVRSERRYDIFGEGE